MKKIRITETQRLMLESIGGAKLQELDMVDTREEIPGIAKNEVTGMYHMALVTKEGYIQALEPKFSQFTFKDGDEAKQYFCTNTERIKQVLDADIEESYKVTEGSNDYKAIGSLETINCPMGEDIRPSMSPSRKVTQSFNSNVKTKGFQAESELNNNVVEFGDILSNVLDFIKQVYTNPSKQVLDPFFERLGVNWEDMISMLTSVGVLVAASTGGYRLAKFVGDPRQAVKIAATLVQKLVTDKKAEIEQPEVVGEIEQQDITPEYLGKGFKPKAGPKKDPKVIAASLAKIRQAELSRRKNTNELEEDYMDIGNPHTNAVDPDMSNPSKGIEIKLKVIYADEAIAILTNEKGNKYFYYHEGEDEVENYAEREIFHGNHPDEREEILPDDWKENGGIEIAVQSYVNDNLGEIGLDTNWTDGEGLTLIDTKVKNQLLKSHFTSPKLAEVLNGDMVETTAAAGSSGAFVGKMNPSGAESNVPEQMDGMIDEADALGPKGKVAKILKERLMGGEVAAEEWIAFEGELKNLIQDIIKLQDEDWRLIIQLMVQGLQFAEESMKGNKLVIVKFKNNMRQLSTMVDSLDIPIGESTTTSSVGGDSGTFAYDAPAGDGDKFWHAGNKMNKGMPMVRKGGVTESFHSPDGTPIGVNSNHEPVNVEEDYVDGMNKETRYVAEMDFYLWADGDQNAKAIAQRMAGEMDSKYDNQPRIQKLYKQPHGTLGNTPVESVVREDAMKNTQYPDGAFVEIDKCAKIGHNDKTAINGGCSQGAVDNVVKYKTSKNSVISDANMYEAVAKETGMTIAEVKSIIENKINTSK